VSTETDFRISLPDVSDREWRIIVKALNLFLMDARRSGDWDFFEDIKDVTFKIEGAYKNKPVTQSTRPEEIIDRLIEQLQAFKKELTSE
jgi:hypothetical protein